MKTIGVLGGMSSVASAEYYRRINEGVNAHVGGHAAADLVLYSVDFGLMLYDTTALHVDRAVRTSLGLHPLA